MKKPLIRCFMAVSTIYVLLMGALVYWHLFGDLGKHPANPRYYQVFNQERGPIYDRNGEILAFSSERKKDFARIYATPSLSHVVGYFHQRYGITGLERLHHEDLVRGRTVFTTIDLGLQAYVEDCLKGLVGAALVIKPNTGEVLALVSQPAVDGNCLDELWSDYLQDGRSPFLNRVTQGLYPPGSLVKPLVYGGALEKGLVTSNQLWLDQGSLQIQNRHLSNSNARVLGEITTDQALAQSSNVVFAQLAIDLEEDLLAIFRRFGLGAEPRFELSVKGGYLPAQAPDAYTRAQLGIGQGELLATPLQMGMIAATIANRGVMMQPYLVQEIRGGLQMRQITRPHLLGEIFPEQVALVIRDAMVLAVQNGTAQGIKDLNLNIAAKTGTAQVGQGRDHAWFMGFAPSNWPEVAVVVVVEHGGAGGAVATPIGAKIIAQALNNGEGKKGKR